MIRYFDASSSTLLYEDTAGKRGDIVVGDTVTIASDRRFGKLIEITGFVTSIGLNVVDMREGQLERSYIAMVKTV